MSVSVVRANALRLPLPDSCVDLIVTSPPYFALRSYQDDGGHYDGQIGSEATPADFLVALWRVLDECWRVLKPSGSCWVNLGDKYAGSGGHNNGAYGVSGLYKDRPVSPTRDQGVAVKATLRSAPDRYNQAADVLPKSVMGLPWRFALGASCPDPYRAVYEEGDHPQWINRRPLIWLKANGLPESVTDRTRANFEDWFMLTKQGRYFSAVDEIRESAQDRAGAVTWEERKANGEGPRMGEQRLTFGDGLASNPLGRLPGSVWTISSEPLIVPEAVQYHYGLPDHFAAFPQEWPRRIILGFSPSGICTACGEGRRPVGDSHVCACNEPMLSPTGSRVGDDPSQLTGRGGLNRPRGDAEGTTSITRWQHNHWAAELRISPHRARIEDVAARLHGPEAFTHWIRTDNSGARPIPAKLREALLRQGWLTEAPAMPDAPTRPPLVIDPFGGTGTVAGVANALGRTGISFDLSGAYCRLARWRIRESGHFAKTASRTDRDRQGSLFGTPAG